MAKLIVTDGANELSLALRPISLCFSALLFITEGLSYRFRQQGCWWETAGQRKRKSRYFASGPLPWVVSSPARALPPVLPVPTKWGFCWVTSALGLW